MSATGLRPIDIVPDERAPGTSPEGLDALRRKAAGMGPCDIFLDEAKSELAALRHLSKMLQASALTYPSARSCEIALDALSAAVADRAQMIERLADYASAETGWPAAPI